MRAPSDLAGRLHGPRNPQPARGQGEMRKTSRTCGQLRLALSLSGTPCGLAARFHKDGKPAAQLLLT